MLTKNLLILLAALCVLSAVCSERFRRSERLGGNEQQESLGGVSNDGWTGATFAIILGQRVGTVEQVKIELDPFRPAGAPRYQVALVNCPQGSITSSPTQIIIHNAWNCSREVSIQVSRTFPLADGRRVGLKIRGLYLSSTWNVFDENFLQTFTMLLVFSLLTFFCVGRSPILSFGIAAIVQIGLAAVNSHRYWDSHHEFWFLILMLFTTILGIKWIDTKKDSPENTIADIRPRVFTAILSLLTICGLALRLYGIRFGLPNYFHPDEARKARIAFQFLTTSDYNPDYFLHPTFLLYLSAIFAKIGLWLHLVGEPTREYVLICGRAVSVVAGSVSIIVCALCTKIYGNRRTALLAAAMVAFSPLTVTCSRYLKEDALVLCMLLICLLFTMLAAREPSKRLRYILLACFFGGLSAGSKYSGIVCIGIVMMTPWFVSGTFFPHRKTLLQVLLGLILIPIGFLITTPYSVITPTKFATDFNKERRHMELGHDSVQVLANHRFWLFHASRSLTEGLGVWVVPVFALLVVEALRRRSIPLLLLIAAIMLFYLPAEYVKAKPEPQPERYVLPCVALLAIAVGSSRLFTRRSNLALATLAVLMVGPAAVSSTRLAAEIYPDTRIMMRHYIMRKIPPGKSIMIDAAIYNAPLPDNVYHVINAGTKEDREEMSIPALRKNHVNYVLLTSKSWSRYFSSRITNRLIRMRYRALLNRLILVKEISAGYKSYGFHNPTLRLYKVN